MLRGIPYFVRDDGKSLITGAAEQAAEKFFIFPLQT
jgi:hypothetical protein